MKNLVEELNKLDEMQYDVSPNFSKDVMKKVYKEKRASNIIRVCSFVSVACVCAFSFIFVKNSFNKNNLKVTNNEQIEIPSEDIVQSSAIESEEMKVETESSSVSYDTSVSNGALTIDDIDENASFDMVSPLAEKKSTMPISKDEYLNEIERILVNKGYIIERSGDTFLVSTNNENDLKILLSNYNDITFETVSDKIKIDINN